MLVFSVDVEGIYEGLHQNFDVPSDLIGTEKEIKILQKDLFTILELMNEFNVKGTFFCLGSVAPRISGLIREMSGEGHEIASHGLIHKRYYSLHHSDVRQQIFDSKKILEDITGQKIAGFRAPDFSINESNLFVLDFIREAGFEYDSSIIPISGHDFYGIGNWQHSIHTLENGLVQFPPATEMLAGKRVPILGGGYFRLYPFFLSKYLLKKRLKSNSAVMTYFHPHDFTTEIIDIKIPTFAKFRHFYNREKSKNKIRDILSYNSCIRAVDYVEQYLSKEIVHFN